jgi:hypothetical protein
MKPSSHSRPELDYRAVRSRCQGIDGSREWRPPAKGCPGESSRWSLDLQGDRRGERGCGYYPGDDRGSWRGSAAAWPRGGRADLHARGHFSSQARRRHSGGEARIVCVHSQRDSAYLAEHRRGSRAFLCDDHVRGKSVRGVLPALRGSCLWTSAAWTRSHVSLPRQERSRCWVRRSRPPIRSDERRDLDTPECIRKHWRSSVSFRLDVPRTRDGAARLGPGLAAPPCPFRGSCGRPAG